MFTKDTYFSKKHATIKGKQSKVFHVSECHVSQLDTMNATCE